MSGNLVQRGEPAIIDKWKRQGSYENDQTVIELFLRNPNLCLIIAVELRCEVDYISFGSEGENLQEIANNFSYDSLREACRQNVPSYASPLTGSGTKRYLSCFLFKKILKGSYSNQ